MSHTEIRSEVLALEEAAKYLRLPPEAVKREAAHGAIPGRQVEGVWRFSQSALRNWLGHRDGRAVFLNQAGALREDESLDELLEAIYRERGRPEV